MTSQQDERHRAIAERAYAIYQARGGKDGLAEEDWAQAEAELDAEDNPAPADAGPNVPLRSRGVGERSGEVMPDINEPGEEKQPLPPAGPSAQ
jgi:hypothetical protein